MTKFFPCPSYTHQSSMSIMKHQKIYIKYLSAAFGSAMITSVYSLVDMAMVGQYQGPDGTAALAVVASGFSTE